MCLKYKKNVFQNTVLMGKLLQPVVMQMYFHNFSYII